MQMERNIGEWAVPPGERPAMRRGRQEARNCNLWRKTVTFLRDQERTAPGEAS